MTRDDFSKWVEARPLAKLESAKVAKFLYKDVFYRHGIYERAVIDGGPENKLLIRELCKRYGVNRTVVSSYYLEANGMVKRGYKPIKDALLKLSGGGSNWIEHLHTVL